MKTWAEHLISFYHNLNPPEHLPHETQWLYPQKDPRVMKVVEQFLHKFYNDSGTRKLMLGINPGRYGAGITGVNFTGPRQLKDQCGIEHPFGEGTELSAEFIYEMIDHYGGVDTFYSDVFISSVCPLGLVQNGKNLNYYDDREVLKTVEPFIIHNLEKLTGFHADHTSVLCIGGEKNFKYLSGLNQTYKWFKEIIPLPHPRFIMQYRRRQKLQFIHEYMQLIKK